MEIKSFENVTERQSFQITHGGSLDRMRDHVGQMITISGYVRYADMDKDGKSFDLLALVTADGEIMGTNSPTAIRTFDAMIEQFKLPIEDVLITSNKSKNNRDYLNLELK